MLLKAEERYSIADLEYIQHKYGFIKYFPVGRQFNVSHIILTPRSTCTCSFDTHCLLTLAAYVGKHEIFDGFLWFDLAIKSLLSLLPYF